METRTRGSAGEAGTEVSHPDCCLHRVGSCHYPTRIAPAGHSGRPRKPHRSGAEGGAAMASPSVVSCPQCQKQIKAPPELEGKKVRCKGCGNTFAIQARPAPSPARKADEEEEDSNPYGIRAEEEEIPRCPICAKEMESKDAVVC